MRLEDVAELSQGIPINRIRVDKKLKTKMKTVYSFEEESKILVQDDIEDGKQNIPLAEKNMIIVNLTSYKARKIEEEDIGKIIPSNYTIIKLKDRKNIDIDYLEWYIDKSDEFASALYRIRQGSSMVMSIPISELRRIRLKLPDMEFQEKIGRINNLEKIRERLFKERKELIDKLLINRNREEF